MAQITIGSRIAKSPFYAGTVAKGATLHCGGAVPEGSGWFYPPTVLSRVPDDADCLTDEIFGPVAAIQTFRDEAEVIRRANDTIYGLVGYVFTGESRGYSTSNGSWTRLKPDSNALEGGLGAWEAALRYSSLDLTEAGPVMKADAVTAGLNWYLTSNTRLQSNIIFADNGMEQDTIFAVRLSFDF